MRIETILDRHLYPEREKQWSGCCRVCGQDLPTGDDTSCIYTNWLFHANPERTRADDPLPHTTSDAQMREDRKRLPESLRERFIDELRKVIGVRGMLPEFSIQQVWWMLINATPEQQAIAMARAFGEKVEG